MNLNENDVSVKSKILPVRPENIPPELKEYDHWVGWKAEPKADGEFDKIPIDSKTGDNAKVNDPSTWGSYARALKFYKTHKKTIAGIGFVLTKDTPIAGGDADNCYDPETGEITEAVKKILQDFSTYSEVSPSGTGIRFFCRGELPGKGKAKDGVELYDTGRFLTITGEHLPDYGKAIEDRQEELLELYKKIGGKSASGRNPFGWQDELLSGVPESERHNTAVRLAGRWARKGLSSDEVTKAIIWWNTGNTPPKPDLANAESKELNDIIHYAFVDKLFGSEAGDPETVIERMNEKHAVIMLGGKCCILNETYDPAFRRTDITFSSRTDLFYFYSNRWINTATSKTPVSAAKIWWDSPNRRQYDGIVFEPGGDTPDGYYNLWRGFAVEPKKGDWSLMKKLILESIASGKQSRYEYIIAWMSRVVQDPGGVRPGVSIVMRGGQGVGKGEFAKHFGSLLGNHFLQVAQGSQVTGRFNSHLKDCVILFVDEGFWAGDKQAEGVIKNLVTEPTISVEPKGKEVFKVKSNINILIASNNDWVVPAGPDERRFFVTDTDDCRKGDYDFFRKLNAQMQNGGREAMLYDLLKMDIVGVNLREFERTDALFEQILESMPLVQGWWYDRMTRGAVPYEEWADNNRWPDKVSNSQLYNDFQEYAGKLKRFVPTKASFDLQFNKLLPRIEYARESPSDGGKRKSLRVIPALAKCRKTFEQSVKMTLDWEHALDIWDEMF